MALLEDILGMIMLIFFLVIGGIFLTIQITSDQLGQVDEEIKDYLHDYYSTSMNGFMNMREEISGAPVHIIIGDYISKGTTTLTGKEGRTIAVDEALEGILNEFYGQGNYYMKLTQEYTDTTISFVFDGSDSNRIEKMIVGENLESIRDRVNLIFEDSGAEVNINLYVLSENPAEEVCDVFGEHKDLCEVINAATLYDEESHLRVIDPFDGLTGKQAEIRHYVESDWMGGTIHAEREFRKKIVAGDAEEYNIHIVIPVFDQLSTSSISDECFEIDRGPAASLSDYIVCRLCVEDCPVERSRSQMQETIDFFVERNGNSIIMPVFSFDCNLRYRYWYNNLNPVDYRDYVIGTPSPTMCHLNSCAGCRPPREGDRIIPSTNPDEYENVCFKTQCQYYIEQQMEELSTATGGSPINIINVQDLPALVVDQIDNVFAERELIIGTRQDDRTRYVFERNIILPTLGSVDVRLLAYELPPGA